MNRRTFIKYIVSVAGAVVCGAKVAAEPSEAEALRVSLSQSEAFQQAIAKRLAERGPVVRKIPLNKKRRWIVDFGPTVIPPNTTVMMQAQPKCLFQADTVICTGDREGLDIVGSFVGKKSQMPTFQNPIAFTDAFARKNGFVHDFDTCDPALFINWQVRNNSSESRTASFSMLGQAIL